MSGFRESIGRSVRAQAAGAFCPESALARTIFLLDYDSYFARCMQQAYPPLRGKPVAMRSPARGSIVIAASTEAKARGVKTGMFIDEAERACPGLLAVSCDMDMYAEICTRSLRVLARFTDLLEPFSIDEAFMDVTAIAPRYGGAVLLAQAIKRELRADLGAGITCSIGIGPNKMIAKLVSHFHKPDGITEARTEEVPALLKQIALTDICGIAGRTERRLQRLGVYTVEQMGRLPREALTREFGVLGHLYWLWGRGIDLTPVEPYHRQAAEKSMGHTVTLVKGVPERRAVDGVVLRLCERLGRRMRSKGALGRTAHLWLNYERGDLRPDEPAGVGGRRTLPEPTNDSQEMYRVVQGFLPPGRLAHPVMQVNISMSNLVRESTQLSLLEDRVKQRDLQRALDAVNDRYGEFTIGRAALFHYTLPLPDGPPNNGLRKRYAVEG